MFLYKEMKKSIKIKNEIRRMKKETKKDEKTRTIE